MNILRKERGQYPLIDVAYLPTPCMHCESAPCVKASIAAGKLGAVYKREDGIIIIDPAETKGMRDLVNACPYGAIYWNEEADLPQKCTFCAHLLDKGWEKPRCVQACPTGALRMVKTEKAEMARIMVEEQLLPLKSELGTEPRVYYKNLYHYETCFIAGSVAYDKDGVMECADGARIQLIKDGNTIAAAKADTFGDFKIDGLPEGSGAYTVLVSFGSVRQTSMDVTVGESVSLGTIVL